MGFQICQGTSCWGHLLVSVALQTQYSFPGAYDKALQAAPAMHALGMTSHHPNLQSSAQNIRRYYAKLQIIIIRTDKVCRFRIIVCFPRCLGISEVEGLTNQVCCHECSDGGQPRDKTEGGGEVSG